MKPSGGPAMVLLSESEGVCTGALVLIGPEIQSYLVENRSLQFLPDMNARH